MTLTTTWISGGHRITLETDCQGMSQDDCRAAHDAAVNVAQAALPPDA